MHKKVANINCAKSWVISSHSRFVGIIKVRLCTFQPEITPLCIVCLSHLAHPSHPCICSLKKYIRPSISQFISLSQLSTVNGPSQAMHLKHSQAMVLELIRKHEHEHSSLRRRPLTSSHCLKMSVNPNQKWYGNKIQQRNSK